MIASAYAANGESFLTNLKELFRTMRNLFQVAICNTGLRHWIIVWLKDLHGSWLCILHTHTHTHRHTNTHTLTNVIYWPKKVQVECDRYQWSCTSLTATTLALRKKTVEEKKKKTEKNERRNTKSFPFPVFGVVASPTSLECLPISSMAYEVVTGTWLRAGSIPTTIAASLFFSRIFFIF